MLKRFVVLFAMFVLCIAAINAQSTNTDNTQAPSGVKTYNALGDNMLAPYSFINEEGETTGFFVELMDTIAKDMGFKVNIRLRNRSKCHEMMATGEYDLLLIANQNTTNEKKLLLTSPVAYFYPVAVCHRDYIIDWNDLKDNTVLVQDGSVFETEFLDFRPNVKVQYVDNPIDGLSMVERNLCDFTIINRSSALFYIKQFKLNDFELRTTPIDVVPICFAVADSNTQLLEKINTGIERIRHNGTYDKLYKKWLGYQLKDNTSKSNNNELKYLVCGLLFITIYIIMIHIRTRRISEKIEQSFYKKYRTTDTWRCIVDNIPVGISLYDKSLNLIYVNNALCKISGIKDRDTYQFENRFMMDDPLVDEKVKELVRQGKDGNVIVKLDYAENFNPSIHNDDMDFSVLDCSVHFIHGVDAEETPNTPALFISVQDITKSYANSANVTNRMEQLSMVMKVANIYCIEIDLATNMVTDIFNPNRVISLPEFLKFIAPEDISEFTEMWLRVTETPSNKLYTHHITKFDNITNTWRPSIISMRGLSDDETTVSKVLTTVRYLDIETDSTYSDTTTSMPLQSISDLTEISGILIYCYSLFDSKLYRLVDGEFKETPLWLMSLMRMIHPDDREAVRSLIRTDYVESSFHGQISVRVKFPFTDSGYIYVTAFYTLQLDSENVPESIYVAILKN